MNNKQEIKRKMELFKKNADMKTINRLMDFEKKKAMIKDLESPQDGAKVKLNYEHISVNPDFIRDKENCLDTHRKSYIDFIENNKETIFTAKYDSTYLNGSTNFVYFAEDTRELPWMWFIGDLIILEND